MREKKIRLCLNSEEKAIVLDCLVDLRNRMIEEGKYTDCVDDMIIKIVQARVKRTRKNDYIADWFSKNEINRLFLCSFYIAVLYHAG